MTEDRKRFGLILDQTIMDNSTLAGLKQISGNFLTNLSRETVATKKVMSSLHVKANSPITVAGTLVGRKSAKSRSWKMAFDQSESFIFRRTDARH